MAKLTAVVLAAGQGTRMKSSLAKVLHPLCGRPMIDHVLDAALAAGAEDAVVVVGHQREALEAHLAGRYGERVRTAVQPEQRGTGDAVRCALPVVDASAALLLYGDTPLVRGEDLRALVAARDEGDRLLAMLTCRVADPRGYGRIIRERDRIVAIREHRDCSPEELGIDEINPGMYAVRVDFLRRAIAALRPDNDQAELYLTDVVAAAARESDVVGVAARAETLAGINDRVQLVEAEEQLHRRIADRWRLAGATIRPSARIDAGVIVERDAIVEQGVVLRGTTRIGEGARVDVGCVLENVQVEAGATVLPYSVCLDARVGARAQVGPFSHLRPGSVLDEEARVGNFVETKKTRLGRGAKASHLAYLGDGDIGEHANIGAGTIFCNYDGFRKHRTVIAANAFVGSDSQIVAPVTIGEGAYVATGTTVTRDVPADALAIARVRQENKEGYATRLKRKLAGAEDEE